MKNRRFAFTAGLGCAILSLLMVVVIPATFLFSSRKKGTAKSAGIFPFSLLNLTWQNGLPASGQPSLESVSSSTIAQQEMTGSSPDTLVNLYEGINPGVVNINGYGFPSAPSSAKSGSGLVFKDEGYILTSSRLAVDASYLNVTFFDGSESEAAIIGHDPVSDLAVLKVDALPEGVQPLKLADTGQVRVGEWVLVMSNPSGLSNRMDTGIISAVGPAHIGIEDDLTIPGILQYERTISEANLGGPLLNYEGFVIGITTQVPFEGTEPGPEAGHAIPSYLAGKIASALIEQGSYSWPWLGAEGMSVNIPIMKANQLETSQGAYIQRVISGSPADAAGLQASTGTKGLRGTQVPVGGDVVIGVDGKPVDGFEDLLSAVSEKSPGEEIKLTIIRDGNRQEIAIKLSKKPED